jgi:hypothetical protein
MFAFGSQTKSAEAVVSTVTIVDLDSDELYDLDGDGCSEASELSILENDTIWAQTGDLVPICVTLTNDLGTFNAQASDGEFVVAICSDQDNDTIFFEHVVGPPNDQDECLDQTGENTGDLTVNCAGASDCFEGGPGGILLFYVCDDDAAEVEVDISHETVHFDFFINCYAQPDAIDVTAKPATVEIVPAIGSSAHSEITIVLSGDGLPVDEDDIEIDVSVPKCAIEIGDDNPDSSPLSDNWPNDDDAIFTYSPPGPNTDKTVVDNIWFHADWNNCTPGDVVVTVHVEVDDGADLVDTVTIKVVGPPAFITATAAPDKLICGEKSTITVKVTDAIGQNVSDNTRVELISNWGSVIAGTGATLGFPGTGPVNPLASSAAATYNGVAIAYLLTSNNHVGPYEVVAAAGGTVGFSNPWEPGGQWTSDPWWSDFGTGLDRHDYDEHNSTNALLYSSAPITTQVTVTCSLPAAPVAPTVTSPNTGTGSITPPNTGDAGLASSSSNAMLLVVVGAAAFVLAGIASVAYARR